MANDVVIIGAGKIGKAIVKMLLFTGDYKIHVVDSSVDAINALDALKLPISTYLASYIKDDIEKTAALLSGHQAVISAASYSANYNIAAAATVAGVSYFDLTEDVGVTDFIWNICAGRSTHLVPRPGQIFMPQCGLAPGFIGISTYHLTKQFDTIDTVKMRVGALPRYPSNTMKYDLTWSTDGLINEYCNSCECIINGEKRSMPALEGLEALSIDGVEYEAFNTSGGLGTLCKTLDGQVVNMDYKTARYPGHRDLMDFLINGLKFRDRKELLKEIFDGVVPTTRQDVVLIYSSVTGKKKGRLHHVSDVRKIYGDAAYNGIELTTASSICACVDLHFEGRLPKSGFVRQEDVDFDEFMSNRFGRRYENGTR